MANRDNPNQRMLEELWEIQRIEQYAKEGALPHMGSERDTKIAIGLQLYHLLPELIECIQRCIESEMKNEPN